MIKKYGRHIHRRKDFLIYTIISLNGDNYPQLLSLSCSSPVRNFLEKWELFLKKKQNNCLQLNTSQQTTECQCYADSLSLNTAKQLLLPLFCIRIQSNYSFAEQVKGHLSVTVLLYQLPKDSSPVITVITLQPENTAEGNSSEIPPQKPLSAQAQQSHSISLVKHHFLNWLEEITIWKQLKHFLILRPPLQLNTLYPQSDTYLEKRN